MYNAVLIDAIKKEADLHQLLSNYFVVYYSALSAGASAASVAGASTTASSALAAFLPARRVLVFFLPAASFNKFSL